MNWIRVLIPAIKLAMSTGGRKPTGVVYPNNAPITQGRSDMFNIGEITKAIVGAIMPALIAAAQGLLAGTGITSNMTVGTAIAMAVTGFFVWLFPNAKKKV